MKRFIGILGVLAVILVCMGCGRRLRSVESEYKLHDGVGIKVDEYKFFQQGVYFIKGRVRVENGTKKSIVGNPLFRVLVKDAKGKVHEMHRLEDTEDFAWAPYSIAEGESIVEEFDGCIDPSSKPTEFAVRWDGNKDLVTDWVKLK